jgi:glycerophosphoryl diester phosphodiesterase
MKVIGHRGAAGHEPENTIRSFERAIEIGVDLIETDLRLTSDGAIVLVHDAFPPSTLSALQATTLEELLAVANGRCGLMLEMKVTGLAARTHAAVAASAFRGEVIYASFHHDELLAIRKLQPDAQTLALIHAEPVQRAQFAIDAQATHAGINLDFANAAFVEALHRRGLQVFVYTVNEPEEIARMKAIGVDGIVSDYPDRVLERLLRRGDAKEPPLT